MTYSEEEWLEALRECKRKHGDVTPSVFKNDDEFPSYTGAAKRFGSWAKAKELAGVSDGQVHECPRCSGRYRHLVKHWNNSSCDRADPTTQQLRILAGLLMGDGTLLRDGRSVGIGVEMTNREYLEWVDARLGIFSTGVELKHSKQDQLQRARRSSLESVRESNSVRPTYLLLTRKHPTFDRFRRWYASGSKRYPLDRDLTPTVVRHWYCCDGTLSIAESAKRPRATIVCTNEADRAAEIMRLLADAGFDPHHRNGRFQFSTTETTRLLNWIGPAPPGFEYKWAQCTETYRRLKPET